MEPEPSSMVPAAQFSGLPSYCPSGFPFFLPALAPPSNVSPFTLLLHETPLNPLETCLEEYSSSAQFHFTCLPWRQCSRQRGCSPLPRQLSADLQGGKLVSNNAAILTRFLSALIASVYCSAPHILSPPLPIHPFITGYLQILGLFPRCCSSLPSHPRKGTFSSPHTCSWNGD